MSKPKYYINYEAKERQCGRCLMIKPFAQFALNSTGKWPRTHCRQCNVATTRIQHAKKQVKKGIPHYRCRDMTCARIWVAKFGIDCPNCLGKGVPLEA